MSEIKMNPAMTYDELMKRYYGGHGHHDRHDHQPRHRGRQLAKSAERLFANYYGKSPDRRRASQEPKVAVSFSADDGETLDARGAAAFEEYVVQASLSDVSFEEYVVVDQFPMASASSLGERPLDRQVDAREECQVDISALLDGASGTNRFAPPPDRRAPPPAPANTGAPPGSALAASVVASAQPYPRGDDSKPATASDDDFLSDMQSILTRQKVYDPRTKRTIEAGKLGQPAAADPRQAQGAADAQTGNSQAIFDKIAQSMQYANTYDMGTVELENRFADFDRTSDLIQKGESDKRAGRMQAKPATAAVATAAAVDNQDFIQDLDAMARQRGEASPRRPSSDDDPFAFLPPGQGDQGGAAGGTVPNAASPSSAAGAPSVQIPNIQIPNIQMPNTQMPNIQIPGVQTPGPDTSAPLGTSTDLGGAFVTTALQTLFGNAADINGYFATLGAANFITWFNQNLAGHGPWAKKAIGSGPDASANFQAAWNNIPRIFGTSQINLLQFASLMSILINEVGATLAPISEKVGLPGHPGIAYAFDSIPDLKASYNDGGTNWTAYRCFQDPDFISAHGGKALGAQLQNTTDARWSGHEYPSGYPTSTNPAVSGFILEADFFKFRGRGLIQTTWRPAYLKLIRFIQDYTGTQGEILSRTSAWAGMDPSKAANLSSNADWDAMFMKTDLEIPCVAIAQHSSASGDYLNLSGDVQELNARGKGSIWRMGRVISGSGAYADLFRRRVVAICNLLGN